MINIAPLLSRKKIPVTHFNSISSVSTLTVNLATNQPTNKRYMEGILEKINTPVSTKQVLVPNQS